MKNVLLIFLAFSITTTLIFADSRTPIEVIKIIDGDSIEAKLITIGSRLDWSE